MKEKEKTLKSLAINSKDTGSSQVQIGLLTDRIKRLSEHFKNHKKDKHSSLGLVKAVNTRKRMLDYLKKNNEKSYNEIITKLDLRK